MKLKIFGSLLVVALAAALVGGATMAWFTSEAVTSDNLISAGTLKVDLAGNASAALNVANIAPGDTLEAKYLEVQNNGTLPMYFRLKLEKTSNLEKDKLDDVLMIRVTLRPDEYVLSEDYSHYGPADGLEIFEGTLAAFLAEDYFDNASAEPLAPEYAAVYKIELWLPAATGNGYQGSEFLGNLTVEAVQSDNQTSGDIKWSESGE